MGQSLDEIVTDWHWPGWIRFVGFVVLAGVSAMTLYARTYQTFDRVRVPVIAGEQQPVDGLLTVPLPETPDLADRPTAIIVRLLNAARSSRTITMTVNDTEATHVDLRPAEARRIDLSVPTGVQPGDVLELRGDGSGWSLSYLEIGTAHGFSHGLFSLVIVPGIVNDYQSVSVVGAVGLFAALLGLSCALFRFETHTFVRRIETSLISIIVGFFCLTWLIPIVSPYKVLLAWSALLICLGVLYLPVVIPGVQRLWRGFVILWHLTLNFYHARKRSLTRIGLRMLCGGLVALFLVSVSGFYATETGFTSLILLGERYEAQALPTVKALPNFVDSSPGYDGQFYAQLALDPFFQDPFIERAIDTFSYRAPRILFSWTAFLLGLGQPSWILQAYAVQNILYWFILAWLLLRWMPPVTFTNVLLWIGCLFGYGLISSVRLSLLAGPSLLLLVLAMIALERGRAWTATAVLGLAGLGRETNLLAGVALLPRSWRVFRLHDLLVPVTRGFVVAMPFMLWLAYLYWSDYGVVLSSGEHNLAAPLSALIIKWRVTLSELWVSPWGETFARFSFLTLLSLAIQAIFLVWQRDWTSPWWRVGIAYVGLMCILGPAVWDGHQFAASRVLLPMTVAFNVQLARMGGFWPLAILGNVSVVAGLETLRVPWLWHYL